MLYEVITSGISGLYQGLRKVQCGSSGSGTNQIDGDIARELERIKAEHQRLRENVVLGHDDALRDSLTGLYNQGYLKAYLPRFIQSAPEGAMACLRLDGMKAYNDEFGFDSGDEAIRGFSAMVVENRPEEVLVIRDSGPALLLLFRNEEEALRAIAHAHPSVAVCASFIPQSDPLALFEAFSRNLGNPTPPFILLTEQKTERNNFV